MKSNCLLRNHPNRLHIIFVLICSFALTSYTLYIAFQQLSKDSKHPLIKKNN